MFKYLGEIETEFKNTLACLSGAQMGLNHKKTGGRKYRDTLPLIKSLNWMSIFFWRMYMLGALFADP